MKLSLSKLVKIFRDFSLLPAYLGSNQSQQHGVNRRSLKQEKRIMSFLKFTQPVQTKLHQFCAPFTGPFSRPVRKFIQQMIFGILKSGSVQLNSIGRALQEKIALKKVTQRLSAHLDKAGLSHEINAATLETQASHLRQCRFVIFDLSDIAKKYAQKMAGLAGVYDGSEGAIARGYWLCNVTAVNDDASLVVPASSELFSHTAEVTSENMKILDAVTHVMPGCAPDALAVFDRGGDRETLLSAHLAAKRQFIVRQTGKRHLFYKGKPRSFKYLSHKVELQWTYTVERIHKNKIRKLTFDCGALPVRLTETGKLLWLVVMKEQRRGYCWLLCSFIECPGAQAAVELALTGYGLRWKIEEVHRQVKMDYQIETIRLERYEALKTMMALLWMAVSFLYTRLEKLAIEIIFIPELGLVNRKTLKDLLRFKYYKLAAAVKKIWAVSRLYNKTDCPEIDRQLSLPLPDPALAAARV
jgi:hypothetical protein